MKHKLLALPIFVAMLNSACSDDNDKDEFNPMNNFNIFSEIINEVDGNVFGLGDLGTFDFNFNYGALSETDVVVTDETASDYGDYVENNTFDKQVTVVFDGSNANVTPIDGVTFTQNGAHVVLNSTKKIDVVVSGCTDNGSLKIYSENKFKLTLNSASITNPTGSAINIQTKKRCYVVLPEGSLSALTDGATYTNTTDGEDEKGCFFSEGQVVFSGKGTLNVVGNCKNAICTDQYLRTRAGVQINVVANGSNGLKAKDNIIISGGVLNIGVNGVAGKGLTSNAYTTIYGGRTTIITSGAATYDADSKELNAAVGVKSDSLFHMVGGELLVKSTGAGGKGVSCDNNFVLDGGSLAIITTGDKYTSGNEKKSPKGLKVDGPLTINNGSLKIRCHFSEGMESKNAITVNGGMVEIYAADDAINASSKTGNDSKYVQNGGYVYACSSSNDGLDSNGTITITGGVLLGVGSNIPEEGIDCDSYTLSITGGYVVGIGGGYSSPTESACTQPTVGYGATNITESSVLSVADANGDNIIAVACPVSYSGTVSVVLSAPSLQKDATYNLLTSAAVTDATTNFHGLIVGGRVEGQNTASLTLSSMFTSYGSMFDMFGGNGFGGGGFDGFNGGGFNGGGFNGGGNPFDKQGKK